MSKQQYQVIWVRQGVWQALVEQAFGCLSETEQRLAETILVTLHNQHIGITPNLVVSLVKLFWSTSKNNAMGITETGTEFPWAEVGECLVRASVPLDMLSPGYIQVERSRLIYLLGRSPLYTVKRLIAPLITRACQEIGVCYLFSHRDEPVLPNTNDYKGYHDNLVAAIKRFAQKSIAKTNPCELFWQDIAYMLAEESNSGLSLPEAEPSTSALFYRLDEPPEWTDDQQLRRLHSFVAPMRTQHRQGGGVRGIRVTRRLEDIHSIIVSEFANPEPLLADRLLNSGYFILEREPKREKLRDMLLIGIMPDCVRRQGGVESQQSTLSADFAKVCWFNLAARLGLLLRRQNLWQSEFRWIEGDSWQRIHVESRLLFQLNEHKHHISDIIFDKTTDSRQQRYHFLKQMNWLPGYLDTRARYEPLKKWNSSLEDTNAEVAPRIQTSGQQLDELVHWVRQVKTQQVDNPDWLGSRAKSSHYRSTQTRRQKLTFHDFAFVHIMVFLPATYHREWAVGVRGMLNLATQIGRKDSKRNLAVVWVPPLILPPLERLSAHEENSEKPCSWMYAAPYHRDVTPFRHLHPRTPDEIASELVTVWLDEIIEEITHA